MKGTGFHESKGLYFQRNENGSVTITKYKDEGRSNEIEFQQTIDEGPWCSAVCNVSAGGEIDGRFYKAKAFHRGEKHLDVPTDDAVNYLRDSYLGKWKEHNPDYPGERDYQSGVNDGMYRLRAFMKGEKFDLMS